MEWVETTGRTLEDAKAKALDVLGVAEEDAELVVLTEPRTGMFGRLKTEARLRARVRPIGPRPKIDRRDRKRRNQDGSDGGGNRSRKVRGSKPDAGGPLPAPLPGAASGEAAFAASSAAPGSETALLANAAPRSSEPKAASTSERIGNSRSGPTGSQSALEQNDVYNQKEEGAEMDREAGEAEAQRAVTFVAGLVEAFGLRGDTTAKLGEDDIEVAVTGADLGLLVGPRGQTLQAVQELTRSVAQRNNQRASSRLTVDIAGYRERRRQALTRFATQIAGEVLSTGSQRALEPMSSVDRKIVHDTVQGISGVVSLSEGEDPRRYVLIRPEG